MHFQKRTQLMIDLGFRQDAIPTLKKYVDLLWAANEEMNLTPTGQRTLREATLVPVEEVHSVIVPPRNGPPGSPLVGAVKE